MEEFVRTTLRIKKFNNTMKLIIPYQHKDLIADVKILKELFLFLVFREWSLISLPYFLFTRYIVQTFSPWQQQLQLRYIWLIYRSSKVFTCICPCKVLFRWGFCLTIFHTWQQDDCPQFMFRTLLHSCLWNSLHCPKFFS